MSNNRVFAEPPLLWGTSSLGFFFSEWPLYVVYSSPCFCPGLPPSLNHFSSRSRCTFFQPPAAIPHGRKMASCCTTTLLAAVAMQLATFSCTAAKQHCSSVTNSANEFCHHQLQSRTARAWHRNQRTRSLHSADFLRSSLRPSNCQSVLWPIEVSLQSRVHLSHSHSHIEALNRGNIDPPLATLGATSHHTCTTMKNNCDSRTSIFLPANTSSYFCYSTSVAALWWT